jgi:uncharacterized damage-inducible protein DinB
MSSESSQPSGAVYLSAVYAGWGDYQRLLVEAVAPLTPDHLSLRAAPTLLSIGEIAAHIIAARVVWFHRVMGEGSVSLAPMGAWDDENNPPKLNAADLERGLERTWDMIADALDGWTTNDFSADFEWRGQRRTRQWIIWHLIEHDLHHGGEISLTLGQYGLRAPDL